MMTSKFQIVMLFAVVSMWKIAEANTGEFLQLKLFNHDFQASDSEMEEILNKADLESHGYIKEVTTKLVKRPGSNKQDYQKSYLYFKVVNCSRIQEIERELDTLMLGALGDEVTTKLSEEMKIRHLGSMGQCRVGLEVLFKTNGSRIGNKAVSLRRKKRGGVHVHVDVDISIDSNNENDDDDDDDNDDENDDDNDDDNNNDDDGNSDSGGGGWWR